LAADRATKSWAYHVLSPSAYRPLFGGLLVLTYAENQGAFLGLGSSLPAPARFAPSLLANAVIIAWGLVTVVQARSTSLLRLISVALLLGGGIGNLIDRLHNAGAVIDFMVLRLEPLQTGIFNLADVAITGGALTIAALRIWEGRQPTRQHVAEDDEASELISSPHDEEGA
jgi:signal peptidase II